MREDQERILAAVRALPGGASGLNGLAMERMREFVRQKVRAMVSARREGGERVERSTRHRSDEQENFEIRAQRIDLAEICVRRD